MRSFLFAYGCLTWLTLSIYPEWVRPAKSWDWFETNTQGKLFVSRPLRHSWGLFPVEWVGLGTCCSLAWRKLRILGCRQSSFPMNIEQQKASHKSQVVGRLRRQVGPLCVALNLLSMATGCLPEIFHRFTVPTLKYCIFFSSFLDKKISWSSACYCYSSSWEWLHFSSEPSDQPTGAVAPSEL